MRSFVLLPLPLLLAVAVSASAASSFWDFDDSSLVPLLPAPSFFRCVAGMVLSVYAYIYAFTMKLAPSELLGERVVACLVGRVHRKPIECASVRDKFTEEICAASYREVCSATAGGKANSAVVTRRPASWLANSKAMDDG